MNILILCTGNSCRSQMSHGFLQSFDSQINVFSAGTEPAKQINAKAVMVMHELGIDISRHRPHHVDEYLDKTWDFVITVCGGAKETCPAFVGKVNTRLHIGFEDPSEAVGSDTFIMSEFRRVRDQINVAFKQFYDTEIKPKITE